MKAKTNTKKPVGFKKQLHHHLKLALVPHGANQYRPHLVRRQGLSLVILAVVVVQGAYGIFSSGTVLGAQQRISTGDLLVETNQQRQVNKLPVLALDERLSKAALLKAQDMFKQQYWAHTAPDGTTPWHWFGTVGYNYAYAGENLAKDFPSSGAVTTAWMSSAEHRANILSANYTQIGLAVVDGTLNAKPTTLVVALYGEPVSALAGVAAPTKPLVKAAAMQEVSLDSRLVAAAKSFTLPALLSLTILTIASAVATVAHFYRKKLPKHLRQSWYLHHGFYKTFGLISVAIMVISLYTGGQI